jgi:hypothetical protein
MVDWQAPTALNTEEAGRRAAYLYNTYAPTFTPSQLTERTALQMAIWEVLYDVIPNVIQGSPGAGRFAVNNANTTVQGLATTYLLDMLANPLLVAASNATWLQLSLNGNATYQDFIGPASASTGVPEPGSIFLLGTGVVALAAFRSRKPLRRRS